MDDHHINSVVEIILAKDHGIMYALLEGKKGVPPANYSQFGSLQSGSDSSRKRTLRSEMVSGRLSSNRTGHENAQSKKASKLNSYQGKNSERSAGVSKDSGKINYNRTLQDQARDPERIRYYINFASIGNQDNSCHSYEITLIAGFSKYFL